MSQFNNSEGDSKGNNDLNSSSKSNNSSSNLHNSNSNLNSNINSKSNSSFESNGSSNEKYSLNFSISNQDPNSAYFNHSAMSSNIISETTLEEDYILLKKKSLLKRKFLSSVKIYYREIVDLELVKSSSSSLYSSIRIVYSKNGYSKRILSLSSSDSFAVRWFYDALVVKYSYIKSDLDKKYNFDSSESDWVSENNLESSSFRHSGSLTDSNHSKQSKLSDFVSQMDKELSEEQDRKLKKKMKFERCSSGEY